MKYYSSLLLLLVATFAIAVHAQYTTQGPFTLFGSTNNEKVFAHCLDGSGSGSVFITGTTDGSALGQQTGGSWDWYVSKYNRNNGFFTANANNPVTRWLTSPQEDVGVACSSDLQGAVYVVGYTYGRLDNNTGGVTNRDVVVTKFDANMNRVWLRQFDVGGINDCHPVDVEIYGNRVYVAGYANGRVFLNILDAANGAQITSTLVTPTGTSAYPADLAVDVEGNAVIVGSFTGQFPGTINGYGETIPATPSIASYYTGFILGFYPNGERKFQTSFQQTPTHSGILTVAIDVNGTIYVGGQVSGSVNGASYQPNQINNNNALPVFAKYDSYGVHAWTRIIPQSDNTQVRQLQVDNIGGIFMLRTRADCFSFAYRPETGNSPSSCTGSDSQWIQLMKSDVNGAVQYDVRVSSGIPSTTTLDNTGVLTISGIIGNGNSLHGIAPSGYDGFVDQITINYNCSCGNLGQLVQEMTQLLNIVPE
jgi:hypothetical protein